MEYRKQIMNCFEEQLRSAIDNTNSQFISINHNREIWVDILKAIQDTKQALTTKSEKEQALEIIVKKNVDTWTIAHKNLQDYNDMVIPTAELTQEEYDLVSKVVKEIGENEKV